MLDGALKKTINCLKQWLEIEKNLGKSALSIRQNFHARILALNLTAIIAIRADERIEKAAKHRKLKYQINFSQALSKMKQKIVLLILTSWEDTASMLKQTSDYLSQTIEAARSGRTTSRQLTISKMTFTSLLKKVHYN